MDGAMTSPTWILDQQYARLQLDRVSARLALGHPDRGLFDLRLAAWELAGAQLLGLDFPSSAEGEVRNPLECYQRGRDLVAAYSESASWPVRVDILWRAVSPANIPGVLFGVDAIVSVRTALLDSWPELAVRSRLPATQVLRLTGVETARFEPCDGGSCPQLVLKAGGGPCCLVFRMPEAPFSYAEMTPPADFQGACVVPLSEKCEKTEESGKSESPAIVEVRHRLFAERLEKGVILRARVRGVVVDRTEDLRSACACYSAFAAADPPLGT
jgi:hypothetical protein